MTPDSFSDGGLYLDPEAAIAHGMDLVAQGAQILDIGGESTRPGAEEVHEITERNRTEPVIAELTGMLVGTVDPPVAISIDTSKLLVAEAALEVGASIVNDVTAMRHDPEIGALCAERDAGLF